MDLTGTAIITFAILVSLVVLYLLRRILELRIELLIEAFEVLWKNPRLFAYDILIFVLAYAVAFSLIFLEDLISPTSQGIFGVPLIILPLGFIIGSLSMLVLIAFYNDFKNRQARDNAFSKIIGALRQSTGHTALLVLWGIVYLAVTIFQDVKQYGSYTIQFYIPGFIFPMAMVPYLLERSIPRDLITVLIIMLQFYIIALNRVFFTSSAIYTPYLNLIFHVTFFTVTTVYAFVRYERIGAARATKVWK